MTVRVGIDTGGTFTDLVAVDGDSGQRFHAKVPSTPSAPIDAVLAALGGAGLPVDEVEHVVLGTTVGANALIERRGATVAYVATEGFEDVPFIQRGNRPRHYDLHWRKPRPFIDRWQCMGVRERIDSCGQVLTRLTSRERERIVRDLAAAVADDGVQAVAVSLLFGYIHPHHEQLLGALLRERLPDLAVSLSHEVAPVWREYERGLTTIADAYLKPQLAAFATALQGGLSESGARGGCSLLRSNGGTQPLSRAARAPVQLLLSGMAGGVIAAKRFGLGVSESLITLDMGGTSCDISVIVDREHRLTSAYEIEFGLSLAISAIDVTTIGAGGGSVAAVDGGGFLRVGPRSAGAEPGPACYARGGVEPTITDANLVLGRIDADYFLGGAIRLDRDAAMRSLAQLGAQIGLSAPEVALAVVAIANEGMVDAIRIRTVEVGVDPRRHCLVAFGGAGPLHAVAVARELGITQVLVPPHPGLGSAVGALTADLRSDHVATVHARSDRLRADELGARIRQLELRALQDVDAEGGGGRDGASVSVSVALRYAGQNYEHLIDLPDAPVTDATLHEAFIRFEQQHNSFYGYDLRGEAIELTDLTVTATVPSKIHPPTAGACVHGRPVLRWVQLSGGGATETPVFRRESLEPGATLEGPMIVEDIDATTLIDHGDRLTVLADGSLLVTVAAAGGS
ncbi:MAG: hydantoinase/oxoprolinase family protein [Solirubrobacteraceae bacterium]